MKLGEWQARLHAHYGELRSKRVAAIGDKPIFALEHGLDPPERDLLAADIRGQLTKASPSWEEPLPWIAYAAEMGYGYAGDEYWQTFEAATPGWTERGTREWLRRQFVLFHQRYGGARPTGRWADHFSIICWPITNAILPRDLQRQLAQVLYQLRHSFNRDVLTKPDALGDLIATRSWEATSRFQNLTQEKALVGQIAGALLLEGQFGTAGLLLPSTLERIGNDLLRERTTREWLRGARRVAHERAEVRGLQPPGRKPTSGEPASRAREQVAALGIEPRLVLRPRDTRHEAWDVLLEIPDLSHLLLSFPSTADALAESRCTVAGASGRPLARGALLRGSRRVELERWPRSDEVLLQFDHIDAQLAFLLRTECLLRPGPIWLFRVASDGCAYELRGLAVRPGQRYVVVTVGSAVPLSRAARPVTLFCNGATAILVDLPSSIAPLESEWLRQIGLRQARALRVWPAGLAAVGWDGDGHGEWLTTEQPCLAIRADHPLRSATISIEPEQTAPLRLASVPAGLPVFIGLPVLGAGVYHLRVRGESEPDGSEVEGELEMVIRTPRPWTPGWSGQGIVEVELDPPTPTLEDVWEGHVAIEVRGPAGRPVGCRIKLFERSGDAPIFDRRLPQLQMPVSPAQWQAHFRRHCREAGGAADAENAYDRARSGRIEFIAQEFGSFNVTCEREFTPLRWGVRRRGHGQDVVLLDDSGAIASASCCRFAFESPDLPEAVQPSAPSEPLEVPLAGGMYVARQGSLVAAVIVPPIVRDIAALGCAPTFVDRTRSLANATRLLELSELWSRARLAGNIMSEVRQRAVLRALTHQLFFVVGGEVWERAEGLFAQGSGGVQELKLAVSAKRQEVGLAAALTLECAALALAPIERRVQRLSSLVKSFVPRESSEVRVASDEEDRHLDRSTDWLAEFALRLASDPGGVRSWAGAAATSGLERLWEKPMLARAARFFVLVVEHRLRELAVDASDLYAGWGWR